MQMLDEGTTTRTALQISDELQLLGATLTAGVAFYLSDTPGGICPVADVGTGEYATVLGFATSTTVLNLKIQESGVAL